jgi:hypothetical protein
VGKRSDAATSVETERFANCKPTKREKVVQKAGKDSLGVSREDLKENLKFGKIVEAESQNMGTDTQNSSTITFTISGIPG